MTLGLTQSLTETSILNLPGSKGRPSRKAYNLTAICKASVHVSQRYGSTRLVTGIASILLYVAIAKRRPCELMRPQQRRHLVFTSGN
jgi:hypothetical protein